MPLKKRYPLEVLLQQREEQVDVRAGELQLAADQTHRAEQTRLRAEHERKEHAARTRREAAAEAERFDEGQAAAQDMMRLHAWRVVQTQRAEALAEGERAAHERALEAQHQESQARQQLADARAQAKVIENHQQRFNDEERKAEERRLEEEIEDGVNARASRRRD